MALGSETRLGPYEIGRLLGAGGMGEVYRARDCRLGREVAVKVLREAVTADPERRARFAREARLLASLNHPNIAALYGLEESGETQALVMELVEGRTLAERLARGPLPVGESVSILLQIAGALEYAHDKGIVHRDLKPANVKLTAEGRVKVLDFGLAKALEIHPPALTDAGFTEAPTLSYGPTAAGAILGTVAYMAPEQATGKPVDRRADIWAFGVVMYECLTGRRLFHGGTPAETIARIVAGAPDLSALPAATPPRLRELLRRCLVVDPKQRLRDIGEARLVLEEPGADEPSAAAAAAGVAPAARRARRERLAWAAFAAAALAALVLAFALGWRAPPPLASLHTSIGLPAGLDLYNHPGIALSPDGRWLALALSDDADQRRQLYLRPLAASELSFVPGAAGASYPFWSPDSSAIGFFAEGKLKRLDLASGYVRTLCDVPNSRGGTWGSRGTIIFAQATGPLQQVPANGGTPVALEPSPESATHRLPEFLPDGRRILYVSARNPKPEDDGVFVLDLETRKARRIRHGASEARYVPPGYLAFVEDGTLLVQPFDARALTPRGDAVPIVERVLFHPDRYFGDFSFSAQGLLAYREVRLPPLAQLTWYDLEGRQQKTTAAPDRFRQVCPSPGGRRALVTTMDQKRKFSLWIVDLDRGLRTPVAPGAEALGWSWSPDGKQIAYRVRAGGWMIADAEGAAVPRKLPDADYGYGGSWSPDGKTLFVSVSRPNVRQYDLATVSLTGEPKLQPLLAGPANETYPVVSPDGEWLLYASDESGREEAYVAPFPGLRRKWPVTNGGLISLWWLSRSEIAYMDSEGRTWVLPLSPLGEDLQLGPPRLKAGLGDLLRYAWSDWDPISRRFLVAVPIEEPPPGRVEILQNWTAALER